MQIKEQCGVCGCVATDVIRTNVFFEGVFMLRCAECGAKFFHWANGRRIEVEPFYNSPAYDEYTERHIRQGTSIWEHQMVVSPADYYKGMDSVYGKFLEMMKAVSTTVDSVYEIGCAWGYCLDVMKRHGVASVSGCDLGRQNAKRGIERGIKVEHASFLESSVPERLDGIVSSDVLEHTETPGLDLQKAFAHLRPGGSMIVKTFYEDWHEDQDIDFSVGAPSTQGYYSPICHLYHFDYDLLTRSLFPRFGFEVVKVEQDRVNGQVTVVCRKPE